MNKKICIQEDKMKYYILILLLFIVIVFYLFYQYTYNKMNEENKETQSLLKSKLDDLENNIKSNNVENYNNVQLSTPSIPMLVENNPKKLNALDRVYNPLRYPYKSDYFYDQSWYPDLKLPNQVIGCGGRNQPCVGGTQVPIYNPRTPIDISNTNISPVYVSTRGPLGEPQQMGVLYKVYGDENDTLPLFGRKKYPNDTKYEYYTLLGKYGSKVNIITKNKNDELGTNDIVFIKGMNEPYRATIYESDFPQYIPYA
jgi:Ca2+/Na+ antiporter